MLVYPRSARAEPVTLSLPRGLALMHRTRPVLMLVENGEISLQVKFDVWDCFVLHPKATAQIIMSALRKIKGTVSQSVVVLHAHFSKVSILLISVRTELIRLIIFALTLVLSCMPPNAGSF